MSDVILADSLLASHHLDRGIAFHRQNMFYEALFEYDTALQLAPNDKYAHWNRATALLALGEYEEGFKEHEWAWILFDWQGFGPVRGDMRRIKHLPIWNGESIADESLLVYHELGFGDGIQTLRYLPELKARARKVTLVINSELVRLAERFDGIDVVDHVPADVSEYSYRLPMFGVMRALKQNLQNIPNKAYIHPMKSFDRVSNVKKVGICWSGRTQTAFSLEYFLQNVDLEGFDLFSLQLSREHSDNVHELKALDFDDTVNVIAQMDHVVTIDSAPAHLAGAMGHPSVHLLLPFMSDWRWWFANIWYPTIKTYRQHSIGDWASPFAKLNEALRA